MAGEIQAQRPTGETLYAVLLNEAGRPWNGTTFDTTPTAGEWSTYVIAMTEDSTMGYYRATMPTSIAGDYTYRVHKRIGGVASEAPTDPLVWTGELGWSGTAVVGVSDLASASDPMTNAASGYAAGTLGGVISSIRTGLVNFVSALGAGGTVEMVQGQDYSATIGNSLDWVIPSGASWPSDLTGYTITVVIKVQGTDKTFTGSVVTATGTSRTVRLELTAAQSATVTANEGSGWRYSVKATSGSVVVELARGRWKAYTLP